MRCIQEKLEEDFIPNTQKFLFGNGTLNAPTVVEIDRALVKDLFFNVTPTKVNMPINTTVSSGGHYDDCKFGNIFFTHSALEYKVNTTGIIFFHTKLN